MALLHRHFFFYAFEFGDKTISWRRLELVGVDPLNVLLTPQEAVMGRVGGVVRESLAVVQSVSTETVGRASILLVLGDVS